MSEIFDVVVIGGGVIGCSIARYLSRFKGNFMLLEKHNDVGEETSNANSAIVHSGYDPLPGTNKAKFNVLGNKMMPQVCDELDVPFKKIGSLTIAFSNEDMETLKSLLERAKINGVKAELLSKEELIKIEPNVNKNAFGALLCPDAGIISPFNLTVSFMENAMDNGFKLSLNTCVNGIKKEDGLYVINTDNGVFKTKALINASGVYSDVITSYLEKPSFKINPTKGEYIILDHYSSNLVKHTLFTCPTKVGKGVLVTPTTSYNYLIGPSATLTERDDCSTDSETYAFLREKGKQLVENIPFNETIRGFAGVRANPSTDDFIIEESKNNPLFFLACGIMSPGLASSPAIGEYISNLVEDKLKLEKNKEFNPTIRKHLRISNMGMDKYNDLIKKEPGYGRFICRCEKVSEGEVVDAIHRNCGAHTIKGVKKRVRAGFGKCQGTFCQPEVMKILSKELSVPLSKVCYSDLGTEICVEPSKGDK